MIAAFACLVLLSHAFANDRGLSLMKQMAEALKSAKTVELTMEGERLIDKKLMSAKVKAAIDPIRYWAKLDTNEEGTEYAALNGKTMRYTGDEGKRVQIEVPTYRVAVNSASTAGYYAWMVFLNAERFAQLSVDNCFYVHSEEIEGKTCDLVGQIVTTNQGEQRSSINYYWLDQQSHLPKAFQLHYFARGSSAIGPKWLFREVKLNAQWTSSPFEDVPETVEQKAGTLRGQSPESVRTWKAGDEVPDLQIEDLEVQPISLRVQVKGRTLLTFWAPWCGPCLKELETLATMLEVTEGKVKVLAVSVQDSKQRAREFAKKNPYPFTFALDPDSERNQSRLTSVFGARAIPHAFLFDANRKLIRHWIGFSSKEELAKNLK